MADTGINVANLMERFAGAVPQIDGTIADLGKIVKQSTEATASQTQAERDFAAASTEITRITSGLQMKTEAANQAAAAVFGTNPGADSEVVTAISDNILNIRKDLLVRDASIQQKLDTKFLDDPLQWVVNAFTVPGDVEAFGHRVKSLENEAGILAKLQTLTSGQVAINNSIAAKTNADMVAADERKNLAAANVRVAEAEQKAASFGVQVLNVRTAVTHQQFQDVLALNTAEVAQQHLQLSRAGLELQRRNFELNKELKDLQIAERDDNMEARAVLQAKLDRATAAIGATHVGVKEYQGMTGKQRDLLDKMMRDGNSDEGRLGYNAADAITVANDYNIPGNPGLNVARLKLTKIVAGVRDSDPGWKQKDPKVQNDLLQAAIEADYKKERNNIPDQGGIYSAAPLSSVLKIPAVAALPIAKLLAPLANKSDYDTKANDVFTTVSKAVIAGQIDPAAGAQQIATMYQAIVADNNTQRQYNKLAIPMMSNYKTSVFAGMGFSSATVIDLTNPAAVETALIRNTLGYRAATQLGTTK